MHALRLASALTITAGLLFAPAAAGAFTYPAQEHVRSVAVDEVVALAKTYWAAQGVTGCVASSPNREAVVWVAPDLGRDVWGSGDGATCEAWLSQNLYDTVVYPETIGPALDACTAVAHELGHAYGLPHAPAGVMAGDGAKPPRPFAWTPSFCMRWARETIRETLRGDGIRERDINWYLRKQLKYAKQVREWWWSGAQ